MTSVALAGFSATGYAHETAEADGTVELDFAHGGGSDGHIPANVNYGFELVGTSDLEGTTDVGTGLPGLNSLVMTLVPLGM